MKSLPLLVLAPAAYLLVCAFASALLAYPLHFILPRSLDFQVLVFKAAQILMLLGLFPLGRRLGLGQADMGVFGPNSRLLRQAAKGFGYGVLMLGLHVLILLLLDVRELDHDKLKIARIASLSWKGALIGLAVAALEEPMFRGFLVGGLSRKTHPLNAVLISSWYFAALHFLTTSLRPGFDEVRWDTGIVLVLDAFRHLPQMYPDSFAGLFAAGAFLGCVRVLAPASGLSYCFGIHAGWVFVLKTTNPLSQCDLTSPWIRMVSPFDGTIGYFSASWTAVLVLLLAVKLLRRPGPAHGAVP
jgi:membrane protease YdiL (CAAX protease family)